MLSESYSVIVVTTNGSHFTAHFDDVSEAMDFAEKYTELGEQKILNPDGTEVPVSVERITIVCKVTLQLGGKE